MASHATTAAVSAPIGAAPPIKLQAPGLPPRFSNRRRAWRALAAGSAFLGAVGVVTLAGSAWGWRPAQPLAPDSGPVLPSTIMRPPTGDQVALYSQMQAMKLQAQGIQLLLGTLVLDWAAAGGRPFPAELALLMRAAEADPELLAVLDPMMPAAERGVPTAAQLAIRFDDLEEALSAVEGAGFGRRATLFMRDMALLVGIGRAPVTPLEDLLARARRSLDRGSVDGAIAALAVVDWQAAALIRPWLEQAQARAALDVQAARYRHLVLQRLLGTPSV